MPFSRFQNRRTKWKKIENISNTEAAEHKLGTRKMSSTSSSSLDHHQNQSVQIPIGDSTSSTCSSTSSHQSDEQIYNAPPPSLIYFNSFPHLLQSSSSIAERSSSVSPSTITIKENDQCSSSRSISIDDNTKLKCSIETRPYSR